jgi:hypothetical protein
MDALSIALYILVVLVVLAVGWFVMKPEKNDTRPTPPM